MYEMLRDRHLVDFFTQEVGECSHVSKGCLLVHGNGLAYHHAMMVTPLVEQFVGQAKDAHLPIHEPKQIEQAAIAVEKPYWHDGNPCFQYETYETHLPLTVGNGTLARMIVADGTGWEEPHRMSLTQPKQYVAHAAKAFSAHAVREISTWSDRNKSRGERLDTRQQVVDHHLIVRPTAPEDIDQHDAVQSTVGMVADGDESPFRQVIQAFWMTNDTIIYKTTNLSDRGFTGILAKIVVINVLSCKFNLVTVGLKRKRLNLNLLVILIIQMIMIHNITLIKVMYFP